MTKDDLISSGESLKFHIQVNRRAMIIITAIIVCFGLLLFLAGLDRAINSFQPDDLVLLIFGALFIVLGYLLWRFTMKPRFEVRQDSVRISNFFSYRTIRFQDVRGIGTFDRKVRPKVYGAKGEVARLGIEYTIEMAAFRKNDGKMIIVALPSFSNNQACLEAIARNAGKEIQKLKDDPTTLANWAR